MSDIFQSFVRVLRGILLAGAAVACCSPAWSADASKPAANAAPAGINAILGANRGANDDEFLPPDQAFQLAALPDGADRVRLQWVIHEGYYLYKSRIKVATTSTAAQLGTPALPTGKTKEDEYFGKQEVYHDELVATVPVSRAAGGAFELPIDVTYQGCADAGLCYPPITKNLKVSLPGSGAGTGAAGAVAGSLASAGTGTTAASAGGR